MKVVRSKLAARAPWLRSLIIVAAALGGVLALGTIDYFTPGPMSFVLFYMLVVILVGRQAGKWPAVFVAGVAVLTIAAVQSGLHRGTPQTTWEILWNGSTRFVMFGLAGWLTAEVTRLTRHLSNLVEQRTAQWNVEVEQHKATAARLGEALERFEQVINNITEVFWLTNVGKNEMAYISPAYEQVWGRKCEELYREPRSWVAALHPADRDEVLRRAQTDQAAGNYDVEYRIVRPDGAVRWIRDRAFPVRNAQGAVCRIAGIAEDITERKRTREVLQLQAAILENMAEGVVVTDEQGLIVEMNPASDRIWGYAPHEVIGQPVSVLGGLPEPEGTEVTREVLASLEAKGSWRGTFRNRRKDGSLMLCEAVISRLELQGRKLMVAVEQDVTERRRAEEQLELQARVMESMADAMLVVDETGTIVLTNPAHDALLGYERGELAGQSLLRLAGYSPEEYHQLFERQLAEVKAHGFAASDYLARRKDGTVIEIETRGSAVSVAGRFCLVMVGQDVTERKRMERALRLSEETLRVFLDAVPAPALLVDANTKILLGNQALLRSLELPTEKVIGKSIFEFLAPELAKRRREMFDQVIRNRKPEQFEDVNAGKHFMNFVSPVLDAAGNITSVAVLALNITERKQVEAALAKQEALYRTLFELSPDGILLEDANGTILDVNQALCRAFGYSRSELLHQNIRWFVPPERQGDVQTHLASLRVGERLEHEQWNLRRNGERCLMRLSEKPLALPDGRQGILVVARDITQSKRAETTNEAFLALGAKLSSVRTPVEATRAIYATADLLWKWDAATLSLYDRESDAMESVLFVDVLDGQRREIDATLPPGPPSARRRRILQNGAELILRQEGHVRAADAVPFGDVTRLSASIMYVPMRRDGQPVGVLSIQSYTPNAYSEEDLRTLQAMADYCAGALDRIAAGQALQQREEFNRTILATAMDGFYALDLGADPRGQITEVNEAFCRLTGYRREELLQLRMADLEAIETPEAVAQHAARIIATGSDRFETRHRRKDGQDIEVEISASRLADSRERVFGFVRDITRRKRSELLEKAFLSLGAKLSAARNPTEAARAIYASADLLWQWDSGVLDLQLREAGRIATAIVYDVVDGQRREITPDDPLGPSTARIHRVTTHGAELVLRQPGDPVEADTYRFGDTSRLSASLMCVPVRGDGRTVAVLSVQSYTPNAYDQDDLQTLQALADFCGGALERLAADAARRESEELLRAFYDSPGALRGVVELIEGDLLFVSANAPQAAAYNRTPESMASVRASELGMPRPVLDIWLEKLRASLASDQPATFEYSAGLPASGRWRSATVGRLKLARSGRPRFAYVEMDITERKRSELLQAVFLSLGAKLSAAASPEEAGRAVYAAADQLWKWDSASLDLLLPGSGKLQSVLNCDTVNGRRDEVPPAYVDGPPSPRMLRIMREGAQLILEDQPTPTSDFVPFGDSGRLSASMMYVPLRREGQAVGVLAIHSYTPNAYTQEDLPTLQALADYCAGALDRLRAEAALREAHNQLEVRVHERTAELQAANEAIRETEGKYRRLHESMTDAFVSIDMGGRIIEFNPAFQELLGYTAEELSRLTYVNLTPIKWHAFEARIVAEQILPQGYSDVYEKEYQRKDGKTFPVELRTFLIREAGAKPATMWAIVRDITQRKQAEAALREAHDQLEARVKERTAELESANAALTESEERYRSLVNNLNVGVYRNTPGPIGRLVHANPALVRIHGYDSLEEFQRVSISASYQDPGGRQAMMDELLRHGTVANYEVHLKKKDGTPIYGSVNATVHKGPDGEVDWIDGVMEDITQRKEAEQVLAEALELNQTLISASTVGIAAYKATGECILANEALARILGGNSEQVRQQNFRQIKSWRDTACLATADAALKSGQPQHIQVNSLTSYGRRLWINIRFSPFVSRGAPHLLIMVTDETETQRAQEALRASEERYRALAESSPDAIFILDREIKVQYVNSAATRLWQRQPGDLIGLPQSDLFSPEVAQYHSQAASEVFQTDKSVRRDELLSFASGDQWIEIRLVPLYSEAGKVSSVMGICRDITDRKRAERQLTEALDLNQKMVAASSMGIASYKASGECVFANEALAQAVGGSVGEVLQGNFREFEAWRESGLLQLAETVLAQGTARENEVRMTTRFGKDIHVDCHLASFVSNGQPHLLLMALDISERKKAEAALEQAGRLQKAILDTIPDPAWLKDREGRFLAGNQALAAFYGRTVEAMVGKSLADIAASEGARASREDKEVMTTRRSVMVEAPATDAQGRERWWESIKSPLFNERDEVIGTVGIAREVTERHRLERQIIEISDREQARIGQDIHDGLCQQLVSLAFDANTLQSELSGQHRPEVKTARRIAEFLDQTITEARQLSRGLFPVRLETEGLPSALEELAAAADARFKIDCRFTSPGLVTVKNAVIATHLYRIAQEALANAIKHSRAQKVSIRLKATAVQIELRIEDDGAGFTVASQKKAAGMGLHIMDYRARAIGGTLQIGPGRRGGTVVSCCIPSGSR